MLVKTIRRVYTLCRKADAQFWLVIFHFLKYKLCYGKAILAHRRVVIKNVQNIKSNTVLQIGLGNAGFVHNKDVTYLNIRGALFFKGNHTIGRGCRFDIAEKATVTIGESGYINAMTTFVISHKLVIGDDCAISWNCQFLDDDFHEFTYEGKGSKLPGITIGNHVWIGCGVMILKGTVIPDGCIIAAGSVVRGAFYQQNVLIAGNPAKAVKNDVQWT